MKWMGDEVSTRANLVPSNQYRVEAYLFFQAASRHILTMGFTKILEELMAARVRICVFYMLSVYHTLQHFQRFYFCLLSLPRLAAFYDTFAL